MVHGDLPRQHSFGNHRHVIAWPDKLGTDTMAYGGFINGRRRGTREGSRNRISTRFSLSMEMSRLTRDGTAEPVSRAQMFGHARGQGDIGNLTLLINTLLYVMTIHKHILPHQDIHA